MKEPVLQFNPFIPVEHEPVLMGKLKECLCQGRWHPEFTDITTRHADKGRALATIADHVGIPLERTVAFGDGGNDISMVERAGVGVAMGNGIAELKAVADMVTSSVDDDGVARALQELGLI